MSLTLILITVGLLVFRVLTEGNALNYGIDFRGGTQVQIEFQNKSGLNTNNIRDALVKENFSRISVIKAGTEGNAYVIRMEEIGSMDKTRRKALDKSLTTSFQRTRFDVTYPNKAAAKKDELVALFKKKGYAKADPGILEPAAKGKYHLPVTVSKAVPKKDADAVAAEIKSKFSATVSYETDSALRRHRISSSGESVRLIFSEEVTKAEIEQAFRQAKVQIAKGSGAVVKRGRQERHKIKWQVRLQGLADRLTRGLNQRLSKFVEGTGQRQELYFATNVPLVDAKLREAVYAPRRAGYSKDQSYGLRITLRMNEKRSLADVQSALKRVGLPVDTGNKKLVRIGGADDKRWRANVVVAKWMPVEKLKAALVAAGGTLEKVSVTLTEARWHRAITSAGYKKDSSISMRITFLHGRAASAQEIAGAVRGAGLPVGSGRDPVVGVGPNLWLAVLDVKGDQTLSDILGKLLGIGAVGVTAVEIPPHGAVKTILAVSRVGSKVGNKLRIDGILSVLYTLALILLYIGLRFDLKFAPGAVVALFHDVMITVGIWAALWLEFNLATIAALLTIVGYSLNDTIVVFDRIRENLTRLRDVELAKVINISLNDTLSRTLLTSITTFVAILPILFLAGGDLWLFAFALAIGVVIGTYSSIYVASPIVILLDNYFSKRAEAQRTTDRPDRSDRGGRGGRGGGRSGRGRGRGRGKDRGGEVVEARS